MAHPTEIVFPKNKQSSTQRLVLRNKTNSDFALKIRGNSPFIWVDPAQGFLRSGCVQPINVSFDASQPNLIRNSPQLVQVFCRPVTRKLEAVCRRWFRAPVENTPQMQQQLAQTLDVTFSDGFIAPETILDLPCHSLAVQSEPNPTFDADDSDTTTARAIDADTETANGISEKEMMALFTHDMQVGAERGARFDWNITTAREAPGSNKQTSSCYWMNRVVERVFPPEKGRETVPPCGAGQ